MSQRQSGRTAEQILSAPAGATYVWPQAQSLWYPRDLARALGREDIKFVSRSWLTHSSCYLHDPLLIVVDHAIWECADHLELEAARHLELRATWRAARVKNV